MSRQKQTSAPTTVAERETETDELPESIDWPSWETVSWYPKLANTEYARSADRNEKRRLVCLDVSSQNGMVVLGQYAPNGRSFLLVYESDVPKLERMLPTRDQARWLDQASEMYQDALLDFTSKECGGDAEKAEATRGFDVWTFYDQLTRNKGASLRTGYPSLRGLAVADVVVPAPETPESMTERATRTASESMDRFADSIARTLGARKTG